MIVPKERIEQIEQDLRDRSIMLIMRAIGKTTSIRLSKNSTITGTVVAAEFSRLRFTRLSAIAVYKVVIEAGPNKIRHTVFIDKLPR